MTISAFWLGCVAQARLMRLLTQRSQKLPLTIRFLLVPSVLFFSSFSVSLWVADLLEFHFISFIISLGLVVVPLGVARMVSN